MFKPRATLGQRQFLINPRIQINIQQYSGKITPSQYKKQTKRNTPRRRPYAPTRLGGGSLSGLPLDIRIRRTWMPVGQTIPSTRHGETTERRADVPLGDGDSDRDVAHSRSGWLSSRSRRQRRYDFTAGRRSRSRFVPRTVRHSLLLLPTTATSFSADVPWLPSRPANQRSTLRSPGNSSCWNRSSQQPAAAALTIRSSTSPHRVSQTQRYHLAHTVEP